MTLKERIEEARCLGIKAITIDGVTYELGPKPINHSPIPDMEAAELLKPMSPFDDLSEDEILYYSTPYFEQLQAQKKEHEEQLKTDTK